MSYKQKKFETPIELHETLGNKYMVDLLKRKQLRKKEKEQQTAARNDQQGRGGMAFYPNNQYFDAVMLNKQLQLEMELERLRGMQSQPVVNNMFDNSAPSSDVPHTPMQQHLPSLVHTPMTDHHPIHDTNTNVPSETVQTTRNVEQSVEPLPSTTTAAGAPPALPPRSKNSKSRPKRKKTAPKDNTSATIVSTDPSGNLDQSNKHSAGANEARSHTDTQQNNSTERALIDTNNTTPAELIPSATTPAPSRIGPPMGLSGASTPQQPVTTQSTAFPILPTSATTTTAPLRSAASSITSTAPGFDLAQVGFGLNSTSIGSARQAPYPAQYAQRSLLSPWQASGTSGVQHPVQSPAMLYSPPTGIATGESSIYSQNYMPNHSYFSHLDGKGRNAPLQQAQPHHNSNQQLNMFVLSAAPNLSYQYMLAQDMQQHYHQQYQQHQQEQQHQRHNQQQQGANFPISSPSQPQPSMHSPGSLSMNLDGSMSLSDELHSPPSIAQSDMTIQEQIHRFAEIRSLFELPSNSNFEDPYTPLQLQLQHGSELDTASSIQYNSSSYRHMRTDLIDELSQAKLKESIDKHKQRLERSRQPKSRPSVSKPSPRARIHKPKSGVNTPRSDYYYANTPRSALDKPHTTGHSFPHASPSTITSGSGSNTTAPAGAHRICVEPAAAVVTVAVEDSVHHQQQHSVPPATTTTTTAADSHPTHSMSPPKPSTTTAIQGTTQSAALLHTAPDRNQPAPSSGEKSPNILPSAEVAPVRELTLEEFERETARIEASIRQTIETSVEEEILLDSQSQHYTKRLQLQTLAKAKKPLELKITAKVDEKINKLKKELEELKIAKITVPLQHQQQDGSMMLEGSCSDDGEVEGSGGEVEVGGVPLPPPKESWFLRNELTGSPKQSSKTSHKQNQHTPHTTTAAATDKQSIDYQIISQDIKKSIEKVIKRHIKAHPGLDSTEVENMLFGSQLEGLSRDTYDEYYHAGVTPQNSIMLAAATGTRRLSEESALTAAGGGGSMLWTVPEETSTSRNLPQEEVFAPPISPSQPQRKQRPSVHNNNSSSNINTNLDSTRPAAPTTTATPTPAPLLTAKSGSMLSSLGNFFSNKNNNKTSTSTSTSTAGASKGALSRFKSSRLVSSSLQSISDQDDLQSTAAAIGAAVEVVESPEAVAARRQEEIQQIQRELQNMSEQLNGLNNTKAAVKSELKQWQRDFERRVGRAPNDADKSAIEDRFLHYQKVSADGKEALKRIKQLENTLAILVS